MDRDKDTLKWKLIAANDTIQILEERVRIFQAENKELKTVRPYTTGNMTYD